MHPILVSFCSTANFRALDKNYLTPFFTTQTGDDEEEANFGKLRELFFFSSASIS